MTTQCTLAELAKATGGTLRGNGHVSIVGVAGIDQADPDQITWVSDSRYADKLTASRAGAVVVPTGFGDTPMPAILCDDVDAAVSILLERLAPPIWRPESGIHPTAVVSPSAKLGDQIAVGPYAVIGDNTVIGDRTAVHAHVAIGPDVGIGSDCLFWPHVTVRERCIIGSRVIVHPQAVIGSDGYGYRFADGRHNKIPQTGIVRIEDDVEIGACTCLDRAKVGETVIGQGTKIDNQVQIAHNVTVGPHCILAAQTGLAGTVVVGQYVVMGGAVAVRDHVTIGDGARVAGRAGPMKDVPAGASVGGIPARDGRLWLRQQRSLDRLPQTQITVRELEKRVANLEAAADHQQDG